MDYKDSSDDNIDRIINDLGACGRFQFVVTLFVSLVKVASAVSMMMMAFGNYNPGWMCLDDMKDTDLNLTIAHFKERLNDTEECRLYEKCHNVQFTPGVSTIVTEWQLLCDKSWISSLIISIQMAGVLIGSYLAGYFGDRFGRKTAVYVSTVYNAGVNIIAIFSNSWQMFTVMRFLIGVAVPFMLNVPIVLALEFASSKWRNAVICLPIWPIGCLIFTIAAMITQDWRYLHLISAAASLIALLPCYWIPESLRWLMVKDKIKKSFAIVKNIAKLNRSIEPRVERLQGIGNKYRKEISADDHSCFHLFRRGMRKSTAIVGVTFASFSIIYYAISFSVKSMPGSLYVNMFIMFSSEFPVIFFSSTLPNYLGRKKTIIIFLVICTFCLSSIVGLDLGASGNLKITGVIASTMIARVTADAAWDVTVTYVEELYPTVIRSTSIAYGSFVSRFGGILAPYFISDNPETYFINYLVMAILAFICCGLLVLLPETKGKPLQDTWAIERQGPLLPTSKNEEGTEDN